MLYLLFSNIKEDRNFLIGLKSIYGVSDKTAWSLFACLGLNRAQAFNQILVFVQKRIDNYISFLLEKKFGRNFGKVLKHEDNLALQRLSFSRCYRSVRHLQNLPVRGQRTHTNAKTQKRKMKDRLHTLRRISGKVG